MIKIYPIKKWLCPLPNCNRKFKKKYYLARHLAMNRTGIHSNWRRSHSLKANPYEYPEINQITAQIIEIIDAHPEEYMI